MILFQSDWEKYPKAVVHTSTRNRSAVKLALKFKKMGIKNHAFFLALHNPLLQNVNPNSPDLTPEEMVMIGMECRENPWYFLREIARAPAQAGTEAVFVEFNRSVICLWWCFLLHITIILTQPRQTGKSFSTDLLMTWLYNFRCNSTQINLMTKDDKLRAENIKRLKDVYEELPTYLQYKTREDANNTEEISVKRLNNTYKTHVPQASPKRAYNMGRGMTTPIFHIDEPPFQQNIEIAMPAALAAMGAAIDSAKRNDSPYGIVYTTTAGKKDDKDGRYFYGIIQESAVWSESLYDCPDVATLRMVILKNSRANKQMTSRQGADGLFDGNFQVYAVFNHRQLGKNDEWLYEQLKRTRATGDDANRDFFNMWTAGTQSSPLPTEDIERISQNTCASEHDSISAIGGYIMRWYIPEEQIDKFMSERSVILGNDPSDLSGGDDLGLVFTDAKTGGVVAVAKVNETNLIVFCKWLVSLFVKYPKLISIIERRSTGATIIDYLLMFLPEHNIDPFRRLFNWVVNDPVNHPELWGYAQQPLRHRSPEVYVRAKKYFGFATSGSGQTARTELYSATLKEAVRRFATRIHDIHLAGQITGLVTKNGRIDHADGEHDDLVVAWLLTHWMLTKGKNLSFYGIDSANILLPGFSAERKMSGPALHDEYLQQLVRNRIDELMALMREEADSIILQRYEQELHLLSDKLVVREGEHFSLDAVLNELSENRRKRGYGGGGKPLNAPNTPAVQTGQYRINTNRQLVVI